MNQILYCFDCKQGYDQEDRRPKFLDCGHTSCSQCIKKKQTVVIGYTCQQCQKATYTDLQKLQDNELMMNFLCGRASSLEEDT